MRALRNLAVVCVTSAALSGCSTFHSGQRLAMTEPPLTTSSADGSTIAVAPPAAQSVSFVDRHPLFYKPKEYYETTGSGKIGKTAAATFLGVPAGIFGELRQIVVGKAPAGVIE